jgi:hypothetical protein
MDNNLLLPHAAVAASNCKLPEYWPEAPALWFSRAKCSFLLGNVTEQREKFCLVVQALPRDSMRLVADLVETPPAELMYNALKERLLHSHQLTDIQKVELLVGMPALGDWKPIQLLAAMVETCPRGQENSVFMSALFLRKLPADVRILLAHMLCFLKPKYPWAFFFFFYSKSVRSYPLECVTSTKQCKYKGMFDVRLSQGKIEHPTFKKIRDPNGWKTKIFGFPTIGANIHTCFFTYNKCL